MNDIEFLRATHITRLQTAARLAGMRWKSGAPGYDKEGIIQKLQYTPSILRACVANIKSMNAGQGAIHSASAGGLMDDIAAESAATSVSLPTPAVQVSAPAAQPAQNIDLSEYAKKTDLVAVSAAMRTDLQTGFKDIMAGLIERDKAIEALKARIKDLDNQRPIEIHIKEKPPIQVSAGAHKSYAKLLQYLQINRRVILTGSAGTGKSMAVKNAAKDLGVDFYIQTPVTMGHELIGYRDAAGKFHETPLFRAYTRGGLILLDEADASLPDALLCANPIFDGNGFAVFGDGNLHAQHPNFMAVFNMNTDGNGSTMQYAGRNRLDGATLARFGVRIHWDIDPHIEASMALSQTTWHAAVKAVRELMNQRQIVDVNATPRHVKTGAALLTQTNIPRATIFEDVLKSGALSEIWADVLALPAVAKFLQGA